MTLRWEQQPGGGAYGYSGELVIAMYGQRSADPGRWWYQLDGVYVKWTAKGVGEVASAAAARRALDRARAKWLARTGLMTAPIPAPSPVSVNP